MTAQAEIPQDVAAGPGALYAEVQQFYAHHMQLLDLGEAEQWADGFTEDAAFDVGPWAGHPRRVTFRPWRLSS